MTDRTHPDSGRITTSSDVIADLHDEIERLERELAQALAAADVEVREADSLRAYPAPREPLTDEQIDDLVATASITERNLFRRFARAIEAAHGITTNKEHP